MTQYPKRFALILALTTLMLTALLLPRRVFTQAGALMFGSNSGVPKVVAVDSSGYMNVTVAAGSMGATSGGTGQTTVTTGDLLYGSATNTWSKLAAVASGQLLASAGVGVAAPWSATPFLSGSLGIGDNGIAPLGQLDVANIATIGTESLTNGALTSGTSWTQTGDMALTGNAATYTHSAGSGTLSQAAATLALIGNVSKLYAFTYTTSTLTGTAPTVTITTAFALASTALTITPAATYTTYFRSAVAPGAFTLSVTSSATGAFTIDTLSLKEVTGGNATINGTTDFYGQTTLYTPELSNTPGNATGVGLKLKNPTSSLVGTTAQWSPTIDFVGNAWDTDDALVRNTDCYIVVKPVTGNTVSAQFQFMCQIAAAGYTQPLALTNTGQATFLGAVVAGTSSSFGWSGKTVLLSSANGLLQIDDNAAAIKVELNIGTAVPTVANCSVGSTGTISTKSTNTSGEANPGSGSTSCDVVFGAPAFSNAPFCTITDETSVILAPRISARATTGFTVTGLTAGDKFTYICIGGA